MQFAHWVNELSGQRSVDRYHTATSQLLGPLPLEIGTAYRRLQCAHDRVTDTSFDLNKELAVGAILWLNMRDL